jgi:uncharacterized RDD family membrane protein YckC
MDNLTIETPEQIRLEFPLAGVGSRFLALALDLLLQFAIGVVFGVLFLFIVSALMVTSESAGTWGIAFFVLGAFLVQFGYFAIFEAVWNGQTPGKRMMHLRVIADSGRPITVYAAVARNLLRIVDSIPGVYAVGILAVLLSSKNKRLGDYVAGTVVVHERPLDQQSVTGWQPAPAKPAPKPAFSSGSILGINPAPARPVPVEDPKIPSGYDAGLLSAAEYGLIETFLLRRAQLEVGVRAQMARQILDKIAPRLQIRPEDLARAEPLLEKLATEYREHSRYR